MPQPIVKGVHVVELATVKAMQVNRVLVVVAAAASKIRKKLLLP